MALASLFCDHRGGVMGDKGYVEAVKWYRKAAEQNYAEAQFKLGVCYEKGQGRCPKTGEASCDAHTRAFFNKGVWWMPPPGRGGRWGSLPLPPPFTPPPVAHATRQQAGHQAVTVRRLTGQ